MKRLALGLPLRVLALALLLAPAAPARADRVHDYGETFVVYTADALIVRPLMLVAAIAGAAVYAVSYPFIACADDERAFDALVRTPASAAFTRCMGCEVGEKR